MAYLHHNNNVVETKPLHIFHQLKYLKTCCLCYYIVPVAVSTLLLLLVLKI